MILRFKQSRIVYSCNINRWFYCTSRKFHLLHKTHTFKMTKKISFSDSPREVLSRVKQIIVSMVRQNDQNNRASKQWWFMVMIVPKNLKSRTSYYCTSPRKIQKKITIHHRNYSKTVCDRTVLSLKKSIDGLFEVMLP